jgi:AAA15 family ATPase/GTPase
MAKNRDEDKKRKSRGVSKKNTVVAMLIALLAFIGIGNWGLGDMGNGEGDDSGGYEQDVNDSETRNQSQEEEVDTSSEETKHLNLYLKEDVIYLDEAFEITIEIEALDELLDAMPEGGKVSVFDKGATQKFVTDVEDLIDANDVPRNVTQ